MARLYRFPECSDCTAESQTACFGDLMCHISTSHIAFWSASDKWRKSCAYLRSPRTFGLAEMPMECWQPTAWFVWRPPPAPCRYRANWSAPHRIPTPWYAPPLSHPVSLAESRMSAPSHDSVCKSHCRRTSYKQQKSGEFWRWPLTCDIRCRRSKRRRIDWSRWERVDWRESTPDCWEKQLRGCSELLLCRVEQHSGSVKAAVMWDSVANLPAVHSHLISRFDSVRRPSQDLWWSRRWSTCQLSRSHSYVSPSRCVPPKDINTFHCFLSAPSNKLFAAAPSSVVRVSTPGASSDAPPGCQSS